MATRFKPGDRVERAAAMVDYCVPAGAHGTVKTELETQGGDPCYTVAWDKFPGVPVFCAGSRIAPLRRLAMETLDGDLAYVERLREAAK